METKLAEAIVNQLVPALATLVAAFIGAWFAFRLTDKAHARQTENQNVAAINRALFVVLRQFNAVKNVRDQLIDPVRNEPGRFIKMLALMPLDYSALKPDFESISFLLETDKRGLMVDLMLENERFHNVIEGVNERSKLHLEVIQPLLVSAGIREGGEYPLGAMEKALGPQFGPHLKRSTEDAINHIDSCYRSLLEFGNHFADEMKKSYPKKSFIKFESKEARKSRPETNAIQPATRAANGPPRPVR